MRIATHESVMMLLSLQLFIPLHSHEDHKLSSLVEMKCELKTCKKGPSLEHFNVALVYLFFPFAAFAKSLRFLLFQVSFHKNIFCYDLNSTIAEFSTILRQTRIKKSLRKLISSFKKKKKSTLIYLFMYTMKY